MQNGGSYQMVFIYAQVPDPCKLFLISTHEERLWICGFCAQSVPYHLMYSTIEGALLHDGWLILLGLSLEGVLSCNILTFS